MIVGSGMLARAFASRYAESPELTVFASGVSNSGETAVAAFAREAALLGRTVASAPGRLVYFGTCSVDDPDRAATPYVRHKLAMESLARGARDAVVIRLPQVVGRTDNPHTLANFLFERIRSGTRFEVWRHAWRNLVDVDDVAAIAATLLEDHRGSRTVVVANPKPVRVLDLVGILEGLAGRSARCDIVERGDWYPIDASETMAIAKRIGVDFGSDYVARTLGKYYGDR